MSNVELKLKDTIYDNDIYDIYIDNVYAGGLEANYDPRINSFYIENIKKSDNYKAGHLLEDVVNYLYNEKGYDLGCLPLEKYRGYYEELGFTPFIYNDNDVYYHKIHKGDSMKTDEFLNEVKNIINRDNTSQKNEAFGGAEMSFSIKEMIEYTEQIIHDISGLVENIDDDSLEEYLNKFRINTNEFETCFEALLDYFEKLHELLLLMNKIDIDANDYNKWFKPLAQFVKTNYYAH